MARTITDYEDRLSRVSAHIFDHLDDDLNFEALAEVAAMSPYHWHRVYHAMRGETAVATARRLRLQRASVELAQTGKPIADIGARAGYGGAQAFSRAFAEAFGMPPARYRREGSHADFRQGVLAPPRARWSIEIRALDALPLVTVAHAGPYMQIGRAFETLFGQMRAQRLPIESVRMIAIFEDDPTATPEHALRSRAGLVAPGVGDVRPPLEHTQTWRGDHAVLRHRGPYADMRAAYLWLFGTWLPQSGREAGDAPVMEEYLNDPRDTAPSDLLTDLFLPLRSIEAPR
jgi:AraC family transcriptional regulator